VRSSALKLLGQRSVRNAAEALNDGRQTGSRRTRKSAACGRVCLVGTTVKNLAVRKSEDPAGRHPFTHCLQRCSKRYFYKEKLLHINCMPIGALLTSPTFVIFRQQFGGQIPIREPRDARESPGFHLDFVLRACAAAGRSEAGGAAGVPAHDFSSCGILTRLAAPRCVLSFFFFVFLTIPWLEKSSGCSSTTSGAFWPELQLRPLKSRVENSEVSP